MGPRKRPQSPFPGCASGFYRPIFAFGPQSTSERFSMFTHIRVAAIRLSIVAVLLVTAAVAAGWKWNRLPLS